jgi:hypothetical protein
MVVGDPHVLEEHLVEGGTAGHLTQRAHLNARRVHVDDEPGEAAVLGQVGVGATDHLADVAVVGARGPHLLTVQNPLVAVAFGAHLQTGQVGACARLAEQLATDQVAPVHPRQHPGLHRLAGVGEDRRRHHAEADAEERHVGRPVAGLEGAVGDVVGPWQAATAQLGRSGDPRQPCGVAGAQPSFALGELSGLRLRVELFEQGDVVVALAPHEPGGGRQLLAVGIEERDRLVAELLQSGLDCAHGHVSPRCDVGAAH